MRIALYNLHFQTLGGGERRTAALAEHLSRQNEVALFVHRAVKPQLLERLFHLDLSRVEIIPLVDREESAEITAFQPDLFINNSYGSDLICPAPLGIYMCMFPEKHIVAPRGYNIVTANSHFTADWIRQRWEVKADVVYSPCEEMGPPDPKTKIILNVGRFFAPTAGNHHKRQDLLVQVFSEMKEAHARGWQLHFAGNVGTQANDCSFVSQLQERATGFPVHFHFSLSFADLRALYRRASLYWHATGFGFDESAYPEKQEHFGMSIIEAMSAGAIPLAHNSGGPAETIQPHENGVLWKDPLELRAETFRLMNSPELRDRLSARAVERSQRYSAQKFFARMDSVIGRLKTSGTAVLST